MDALQSRGITPASIIFPLEIDLATTAALYEVQPRFRQVQSRETAVSTILSVVPLRISLYASCISLWDHLHSLINAYEIFG